MMLIIRFRSYPMLACEVVETIETVDVVAVVVAFTAVVFATRRRCTSKGFYPLLMKLCGDPSRQFATVPHVNIG